MYRSMKTVTVILCLAIIRQSGTINQETVFYTENESVVQFNCSDGLSQLDKKCIYFTSTPIIDEDASLKDCNDGTFLVQVELIRKAKGQFYCIVKSNNKVSLVKNITATLLPTYSTTHLSVIAGESAMIKCFDDRPELEIKFEYDHFEDAKTDHGILFIPSVPQPPKEKRNPLYIKCLTDIRGTKVEQDVFLKYEPDIEIVVDSQKIRRRFGYHALLTCVIRSKSDVKVAWSYRRIHLTTSCQDDRFSRNNEPRFIDADVNTTMNLYRSERDENIYVAHLNFTNLSGDKTGKYKCIATNQITAAAKEIVLLVVGEENLGWDCWD